MGPGSRIIMAATIHQGAACVSNEGFLSMLILFGYDADQVVDEWMSLFQERKHSILYEN